MNTHEGVNYFIINHKALNYIFIPFLRVDVAVQSTIEFCLIFFLKGVDSRVDNLHYLH